LINNEFPSTDNQIMSKIPMIQNFIPLTPSLSPPGERGRAKMPKVISLVKTSPPRGEGKGEGHLGYLNIG
jgi:hypothetical protein